MDPRHSKEGYVTLVTNDNYAMGAMILGTSLRLSKTNRRLICMISEQVSQAAKDELQMLFDHVVRVTVLESGDEKRLNLLGRPELGVTVTKIQAWRLTEYEKLLFLDADTMVMQNIDHVFDRQTHFAAAPDIGWPDCFNSGVFLFAPSVKTHQELLQKLETVGSFDGGDQGLLNQYFHNWLSIQDGRLPFLYNVVSNAVYSYKPAYAHYKNDIKVFHFIGPNKPWRTRHESSEHPNKEFIDLWWSFHDLYVTFGAQGLKQYLITNTFSQVVNRPIGFLFSNPSTLPAKDTKQVPMREHFFSQNYPAPHHHHQQYHPQPPIHSILSHHPSFGQHVHFNPFLAPPSNFPYKITYAPDYVPPAEVLYETVLVPVEKPKSKKEEKGKAKLEREPTEKEEEAEEAEENQDLEILELDLRGRGLTEELTQEERDIEFIQEIKYRAGVAETLIGGFPVPNFPQATISTYPKEGVSMPDYMNPKVDENQASSFLEYRVNWPNLRNEIPNIPKKVLQENLKNVSAELDALHLQYEKMTSPEERAAREELGKRIDKLNRIKDRLTELNRLKK